MLKIYAQIFFKVERGGVRITKRGIITLVCLLLGAVLLGAVPILISTHRAAATEEDNRRDRELLASVMPGEVAKEDTDGFALHILCDVDASEFFAADGAFSTLSEHAVKRNAHFSLETGSMLFATLTQDFVQTAKEDILSGELIYNLYAADADLLASLLSTADLADVSDSFYIRTEDAWFDGAVMDELSVYGGTYLISSSAADARLGASVIAYNRMIEDSFDMLWEDGKPLAETALDGKFTVETMLMASRTVCAAQNVSDLPDVPQEDVAFHGFAYSDADLFSLYFGAGGRFASTDAESVFITSLTDMRMALDSVQPLLEHPTFELGEDVFFEGRALFTVCTIEELIALRESDLEIGILPLPKASSDAEYHTYIDAADTTVLAIPKDAKDRVKVEFLVSRLAFLSYGYIEPFIKEQAAAGNPDDEKMLDIISESASTDLCGLFGYGNMQGLVAETLTNGDDRLTLDYYNRKTLYEKALSIIGKRLLANTAE